MQGGTYRGLLFALAVAAMIVLVLVGWRVVLAHYAGAWRHAPEDARWVLSKKARALIAESFGDADKRAVLDNRVSVLSRGQLSGPDSSNTSRYRVDESTGATPLGWVKARMGEYAAGIRDDSQYDAEYISRLLRQIRAMPEAYRIRLFARDAVYDSAGHRQLARTPHYVDNGYIAWLAAQAPDAIAPVVSVHPYRADAAAVLTRWAKAGVAGVSWLPVAQHIDLDDPRLADCYRVMAKYDMTLFLPVGYRKTLDGNQGWIDPAAVVDALAAGIDVVLTLGDTRPQGGRKLMAGVFDLLERPDLAKHLSIDLAGVLAPDQLDDVLEPLLQHPQFFSKLRYASGYPRSAVASAIDLQALADHGFIDAALVEPLAAIYDVNPLLCAFVTMRQVHLPGWRLYFPDRVFYRDKVF